jgi:RNA polymerase sigma-70 factor, ECF subfamily
VALSEARQDEEDLDEAIGGDRQAFGRLVRRYQSRIFALGLRMLRNQEEALDFAQEVFVKAYGKLHTFRGEGRFYSWLFGLAWRQGLDMLRARRGTPSLAELEPASTEPGPEAAGLAGLARAALARAIAGLPERYRQCVVLFFFFGLTYDEIHRITGAPVNTLKSHVLRAKQLLRQALKHTDAEVGHEL